MENKILIKKYLKLYLTGEKIFEKDKEKAYGYFKESLLLLDEIRKTKIKEKHEKILNETETNSYKFISLTIESSIDTENITNKSIDNNLLINCIETGDLTELKKYKYGEINFLENDILHHAIRFGDASFLKLAFKLGAKIDTPNCDGYTLLEYACLQQDPNMINCLISHGANMKKHLYFRDGTLKYLNKNNHIDICILLKIIISYLSNDTKNESNIIFNKIILIKNLLNLNEIIGLDNFTYNDLINGLFNLLNKLNEEYALTYLNIVIEELNYTIKNKLGCPKNKLELILINLVPFIEYPFNISIDWVISLELKYLILKLIRQKKKLNSLDIKNELFENIWNNYINNELIQENYIGILIYQWIARLNSKLKI